jgi:hypothetical protein
MRISVETCAGRDGAPMPARFRLGRARVRVVETLDQWYGPDYRYIKVMGDDRCLYILRFHDAHEDWELTMFKSERAKDMMPTRPVTKRLM